MRLSIDVTDKTSTIEVHVELNDKANGEFIVSDFYVDKEGNSTTNQHLLLLGIHSSIDDMFKEMEQ